MVGGGVLLDTVDALMTACSHQITFLLLFEGNCGVICLLIRQDEMRFVALFASKHIFSAIWALIHFYNLPHFFWSFFTTDLILQSSNCHDILEL